LKSKVLSLTLHSSCSGAVVFFFFTQSFTAMNLTKSIFRLALATALLLLIPLVAMQFSQDVNWTLFDFGVAGALLFGAGLAYVLVARMGSNGNYRLAAGLAIAAGLLLVWGNLAVGFLGSEDNPANLLYSAVLAVALVGVIAARFRPLGMARAMFGAALTQFLVPFVAMLIWHPEVNLGLMQVLVLNALFAGLWAGAGGLFWRAAVGSEGRQLA
jgi:hypothetical protein